MVQNLSNLWDNDNDNDNDNNKNNTEKWKVYDKSKNNNCKKEYDKIK